jgi:hypothetical protein
MMRVCDVDGCETVIGSHSLFCRRHLEMLPQGMIYHIHAAYLDYRRNIAGGGERYLDLVASAEQIIAERQMPAQKQLAKVEARYGS